MKKIFALIALLSLFSCDSTLLDEKQKTLKSNAASNRINSSATNNEGILKDVE